MLCLSVSAELFGNLWQTKHFGIVSKIVLIIKMMKDKSKILVQHVFEKSHELQPGNKAGQWKSALPLSSLQFHPLPPFFIIPASFSTSCLARAPSRGF